MIIIKTLARIFKELGYIEQWGTGMRKIYEYSQSAGLKTPEISEKGKRINRINSRWGEITF